MHFNWPYDKISCHVGPIVSSWYLHMFFAQVFHFILDMNEMHDSKDVAQMIILNGVYTFYNLNKLHLTIADVVKTNST